MTAQPIADADPAAWLKAVARRRRGGVLAAGLLAVADVAPAVGFACGLAMTVGRLGDGAGPAAVAPWLLLAAVSLIMRGLVAQAAVVVGARLARAAKADVRKGLLADLFSRGRRASARMTALVEGVEALDGYYARFLPLKTAAAVTPLVVLGVMALASPVAAGVLLVLTLLPFILGMMLAGTAAAGEARRQFAALERLSGLFVDRVRAMPAILAFGAEGRVTREVAAAASELGGRSARVMRIAFVSSAVLEFFSALAVALAALYCGLNLLGLLPFPVPETLTLAQALFVLALAPEVYQPLRRLAAAYHDRQAAEAAAPALDVQPCPERPRLVLPPEPPAIRFRRVRIAYGQAAPVLDGFDLGVRPGQIVALTGASGAGKSSLLHLLLGLAPLSGGEVEVAGVGLSEAGDFAGQIAWASQTPIVLPGTLGDNIRIADPAACPGRILAAAGRAGLTGDLDRPIDERGGGLSGGERRRLSLARALLKRAPILLLDEPTAHLDAAAEQAVLDVVRRAARGRTTLIATHSEAVAAMADRVVRL